MTTYTPGSTYYGFQLEKQEHIEEIHADVYLFTHKLLGCPLLAIKNSDPNKTFAVAFSTIPEDSTGVAHILEHSVLMGSKKFPIKDVFGELNKGGLTTFLNAMTGSDITYYPFATRNLKEYFNVMDVYCDVVFNPLLQRTTFEQEGWHYHLEKQDGEMCYQGVVYNEMKGAFSDPIRLIFQHIFKTLMPDSTYAHESGGDPQNIPELTYEQFCDFHQRHYHPSNATFFLYGNAPLDDELRFLASRFLNRVTECGNRCSAVIGNSPQGINLVEDTYAVESDETKDKTFLAVSTLIGDIGNREESTAFQIIANILFNSDGSPLKATIISSGLCKDFGGFFMGTSTPKTFMVTYLVGSNPENRDTFLDLYRTTLTEMVTEGLDRELVISELNKFEFSSREDASKAQRGLDLIGRTMPAFKYGTDPLENLVTEELIQTIRAKALNEKYFEELIKAHLLSEKPTVALTLIPDPAKGAETRRKEKARIDNYRRELSGKQEAELCSRTQELMQLQLTQNTPEALARLPKLGLDDLPTDVNFHVVHPQEMFGSTALINELATNGISYIDIGFDFSALPQRLLPYLDIFGTIITEIGTESLDYQHFAKEVATCTGSLSHSVKIYAQQNAPSIIKQLFWLHTKCLPNYLEKTIDLLCSVLREFSFKERQRVREIVGREFAWAEHSAQSEGYTLAASRAFVHLSTIGTANELINGITGYRALKELALNYDKREEAFLADLQLIAETLFTKGNLHLCFTGEEQELSRFTDHGAGLAETLPIASQRPLAITPLQLPNHEAFITSAEIVYAVQTANLLPEGRGYNGHLEVLRTFLARDYLWNTVRQMGGAYGCFIQFSSITGNFALISYRDPQVRKTYEAYARIPEIVAEINLPPEVLQQLIIGTYGNFDPLQSPYGRAATARNEYFSGITPESKQQRLQEITTTTTADLRNFADNFRSINEETLHRSIIGNREKIEADRDLFDTISEL